LLEATNTLAAMQRGAASLLAPFLDPDELARLEQQERAIFARFWMVWYRFAFRPRDIISNAIQECPRRADALLRETRNKLRRAFERRSTPDNQLRFLSDTIPWNDTPALWVALDCTDLAATVETRDAVLATIRTILGTPDLESLQHFVFQQSWTQCVIVPLVRGKLLEASAWPILLSTVLAEAGLNWIHGLRQPLPQDTIIALDLQVWSLPKLAVATQLLAAANTIQGMIGHLRHFRQLGDTDDAAFPAAQTYITAAFSHFGTTFQSLVDAAGAMLDQSGVLPPAVLEERPFIVAAMRALVALIEGVSELSGTDGRLDGSLDDILARSDSFEQLHHHATIAYYAWVMDVLDEHAAP
jgi:hypothetical protein